MSVQIDFKNNRNSAYMAGFLDAITWCMGNPEEAFEMFDQDARSVAVDVQLLVGEAGMLFERSAKSLPVPWSCRANAPYDVMQIKIPRSSEMT